MDTRKDRSRINEKIIIYITPDKVLNYDPPLDKLVKLVIKGEEAEIKTIAKFDKINELKKRGVLVVFKSIQVESHENKFPKTRVTYKERLISDIIEPELLLYFLKYFN